MTINVYFIIFTIKTKVLIMLSLSEIFSINVRKLLLMRGWSYARLADECKGELSRAYISSFKHGDKVNVTLSVLETVAKAFDITPQSLLDPTLDYNRADVVPDGFVRDNYLLTDSQAFTVKKWEKVNLAWIKNEDQKQYDALQKLKE